MGTIPSDAPSGKPRHGARDIWGSSIRQGLDNLPPAPAGRILQESDHDATARSLRPRKPRATNRPGRFIGTILAVSKIMPQELCPHDGTVFETVEKPKLDGTILDENHSQSLDIRLFIYMNIAMSECIVQCNVE